MDYGTGAIFGCPSGDQRDLDFARKYDLPVVPVVMPKDGDAASFAVGSEAFTDDGVMIVAISQCPAGSVAFDTYAAGSRLRDTGLISAGGMTREAALGKLFALLGAGLDADAAEHWFALDLCGERA